MQSMQNLKIVGSPLNRAMKSEASSLIMSAKFATFIVGFAACGIRFLKSFDGVIIDPVRGDMNHVKLGTSCRILREMSQ